MKRISLKALCLLLTAISTVSCHQNANFGDIPPPQIEKEEIVNRDSIIKPGVGFDYINIGDTKELALQKIRDIPRIRFDAKYDVIDYPNNIYNESVIRIADVNSDRKVSGSRAKIFLNEGKVFQIKVSSNSCKTVEGLGMESLLDEVKTNYPNGIQFILKGSLKSNLTGPKDLIYWVDENQGIAFEFYYHSKEKNRKVSAIFIIQPKTSFFPLGSDIAPEFTKWVKEQK